MISQAYIEFFQELKANNNREWFHEHKGMYERDVKEPFIELVRQLIPAVMEKEPAILPDPKKALFRINRDIRFSKDKTPYNLIMKAGLSPGGKKSELPGYYLGIDAEYVHIGGGLYQLDKQALASVRRLIAQNLDEFEAIISDQVFVEHFGKLEGERAKRLDSEFKEVLSETLYIANKQFYSMAKISTRDFVKEENQINLILTYFNAIHPLHAFLNKAF